MQKKKVFPHNPWSRKKNYTQVNSFLFWNSTRNNNCEPWVNLFFMRNIYRNTFFIRYLIVFLGLQKDRELFNASPFLTLIWSHSVIKSSLMVLFFRLSASRSFFKILLYIYIFFSPPPQAKLPQPLGYGTTPGQVLGLIYHPCVSHNSQHLLY